MSGHFRSSKTRYVLGLLSVILSLSAVPVLADDPTWGPIELRADLYYMRNQEIWRGDDISATNKKLMEEINKFEPSSKDLLNGISFEQAQKIINRTNTNKVTGQNYKYDPKGEIGFCFGRALYAHLELLRHGVAKDSIKKVFIVGPMRAGGIDWQFHVATLVKANDKSGWYAVDTFIGRPVLLEDWFANFQKFSTDGKLRMYVTKANKIGPNAWEYNIKPGGLFDGFYNDYFKDMFQFFKDNRLSPEEKFIQRCSKIFTN